MNHIKEKQSRERAQDILGMSLWGQEDVSTGKGGDAGRLSSDPHPGDKPGMVTGMLVPGRWGPHSKSLKLVSLAVQPNQQARDSVRDFENLESQGQL